MIAKIENKGTVNLYTLLDADTFEKLVSLGSVIKDLKEREIVEAEISIKTTSERFVLKTGETKFIKTASTFVADLKRVKNDA